MIEYLECSVFEEFWEEYGTFIKDSNIAFTDALKKIYVQTGKKFIFLIDEWDCVMRERQESEDLQRQYLDFLRNLLKDQPCVAMAYMTGILPVDETSRWYDGFRLRRFKHVYNPRSVVAAMRGHYFSNYWTSTETYEALKIYMDMDFDGLRADIVRMLSGGGVRVNTFSFQNDMRTFRSKDDVLTLLIHLGYLGYDAEKKEAFIPNKEIMGEFENAMGAAITLAYYSARKDYKIIRELPAGRGFADIVFLPLPSSGKPALVMELKYDKSAETAIRQIKDRRYTEVLKGYSGEILLTGVSYDGDNKNKPHSCVIEKMVFDAEARFS